MLRLDWVWSKGVVPNVHLCKKMRTVSEQDGRHQRNVWAIRMLELLFPPKGWRCSKTSIQAKCVGDSNVGVAVPAERMALFEDLDPCCWRRSCQLVVEDFRDATLLSNNLLKCPTCVQRGA